jgi:Iron/manganese superoxide dismutases, C-terminal domain
MKPKSESEPKGKIADAIRDTFGSFDVFGQQFNDAGAKQFWQRMGPAGRGQIQAQGCTPPTRGGESA